MARWAAAPPSVRATLEGGPWPHRRFPSPVRCSCGHIVKPTAVRLRWATVDGYLMSFNGVAWVRLELPWHLCGHRKTCPSRHPQSAYGDRDIPVCKECEDRNARSPRLVAGLTKASFQEVRFYRPRRRQRLYPPKRTWRATAVETTAREFALELASETLAAWSAGGAAPEDPRERTPGNDAGPGAATGSGTC